MPFQKGFDPNRVARRDALPIINGYSLPELCRAYAPEVMHMLYSVAIGVSDIELDSDGFPVPVKYAVKDRIRAGVEILNRGFGRPLDHAAMRDLARGREGRTVDFTTDELQALIDKPPDETIPASS